MKTQKHYKQSKTLKTKLYAHFSPFTLQKTLATTNVRLHCSVVNKKYRLLARFGEVVFLVNGITKAALLLHENYLIMRCFGIVPFDGLSSSLLFS